MAQSKVQADFHRVRELFDGLDNDPIQPVAALAAIAREFAKDGGR